MEESTRLNVVDTDDDGLRRLTYEHLKVFAKFTSPDCAICELLAPSFAKFADSDPFAGIRFLRLNSDENPVAQKMMQEKVAPFFVSYCQGRILECDTLFAEAEVHAMLTRLRQYRPQAV